MIPGAVDHVIAVHAKARKGTSPGFIGNLQLPKAPGGVTGDLWKCKTSLEAHEVGTWILSMFDDTSWKLADTIESENPEDEKEEVKPVLDISPFAQWIWAPTKSQLGGTVPLEVFCRSTSMSSNASKGLTKTSNLTQAFSALLVWTFSRHYRLVLASAAWETQF